MDHLSKLENNSIYIIREAYHRFREIASLWSIGKDSTTLVWLCRKAFFGKLPFPVIHIDTGRKFAEMYEFRDKYSKEWGMEVVISQNKEALERGVCPEKGKLECCTELKTNALKETIARHGFRALLLGIRRDEHGIRAKERVFSPRDEAFTWDYKNQPPELWDFYKSQARPEEHLRVHPLLDWSEVDVWRYVERENIPINPLYFSRNGMRYRSLGCATCCSPIESEASNVREIVEELERTKIAERSGRAQDKESAYMMQKLRSLGYM